MFRNSRFDNVFHQNQSVSGSGRGGKSGDANASGLITIPLPGGGSIVVRSPQELRRKAKEFIKAGAVIPGGAELLARYGINVADIQTEIAAENTQKAATGQGGSGRAQHTATQQTDNSTTTTNTVTQSDGTTTYNNGAGSTANPDTETPPDITSSILKPTVGAAPINALVGSVGGSGITGILGGALGGAAGLIGALGEEQQFNRRETFQNKLRDFAADATTEYRQAIFDPLQGDLFKGTLGAAKAGTNAMLGMEANREAAQRAQGQVFAGSGARRMEAAAGNYYGAVQNAAQLAENSQTAAVQNMLGTAQSETNAEWDQWQRDYEAGRHGFQNKGWNKAGKILGGVIPGIAQGMNVAEMFANATAKKAILNKSLENGATVAQLPYDNTNISSPEEKVVVPEIATPTPSEHGNGGIGPYRTAEPLLSMSSRSTPLLSSTGETTFARLHALQNTVPPAPGLGPIDVLAEEEKARKKKNAAWNLFSGLGKNMPIGNLFGL